MYTSLIENTHAVAAVIFLLAALYLFIGLVRPSWAGAAGRGSVILRSLLGIFLSVGLYVGVIVYTHMQPAGPHSIDGYIKNFDWDQYRSEREGDAPAPAQQPAQSSQ